MKNFIKMYKKTERFIGSLKFAVIIILLFAVFLIVGTFLESWNGTEYAQKVVYKSWWFILSEFLMFLSILIATLVRLPPKKSLYGFYAIHSGLILIFIGSFITYVSGIDGSIELVPGKPSNKIILPEDVLKIHFVNDKKSILVDLPSSAFTSKLNLKYKDVELLEYLPSADEEKIIKKSEKIEGFLDHSGDFFLSNEQFGQNFTLSLNPNSDFKSTTKLGLLTINYMPEHLHECFVKPSKSGYVIWDLNKNTCYTAEEKKIEPQETKTKNVFLVFKDEKGAWLKFFPDFSPMPLNDDLTKIEESNFRVFSKKLFEKTPNLFIFGRKVAFYKERKKAWISDSFDPIDKAIELPWMNFKLSLIKHYDNQYPVLIPVYTKPIQDNGRIIHGNTKAVKLKMGLEEYWVTTEQPLILRSGEEEVRFQLIQKEVLLPYEINLDRFKMGTDPGTMNPASYESFVTVFDGRKKENASFSHHIYMNNPLKYNDFTFYQASYFPLNDTDFGSVLTVNFDPGRFMKYLGSFLLVFGSIWHYFIRRKKGAKFFSREEKE